MFLYKFSIDVNDIVVLFYFYSVKNKSKILPLTGCHGNETSARYCEKVIFHFTVFLGISRVAKKSYASVHLPQASLAMFPSTFIDWFDERRMLCHWMSPR